MAYGRHIENIVFRYRIVRCSRNIVRGCKIQDINDRMWKISKYETQDDGRWSFLKIYISVKCTPNFDLGHRHILKLWAYLTMLSLKLWGRFCRNLDGTSINFICKLNISYIDQCHYKWYNLRRKLKLQINLCYFPIQFVQKISRVLYPWSIYSIVYMVHMQTPLYTTTRCQLLCQ